MGGTPEQAEEGPRLLTTGTDCAYGCWRTNTGNREETRNGPYTAFGAVNRTAF